ncbi:PspC domain-containing protein [Amycolatopsis jiangsuensis]|uniref:Phage shock protein PspC (Stress-responsive transcriptional regulator) n=1 Tax=Amycolatopsis jiangsuensis TaxID=1181879 RepID=A0A840IZ37_9PSEU|nr:PspC domain-containing protein [Amycolatopsis jiangsuensis]MBB4687946.1 phage shock protein PspC (stress-responsive transcriptional regulator) [Amycolatopsis jiangsuensis]
MTNPTDTTYQPQTKKLHRSRTDRMITGVCGGWADYLGVDPAMVRIATVAATVLSAGVMIPVYLAAVFLTPEAGA